MVKKLALAISKFFFCLKVSRDFKTLYQLIYFSKKYSNNFKRGFFPKNTTESRIYKLNFINDFDLKIRDFGGDFDIFYEVFWKKNYQIPEKYLPKKSGGYTIVDLGANVGYTAIFLNLNYPESKVFAVEASAQNFNFLKENTFGFRNISLINGAVYKEDGSIYFSDDDLMYNSKISNKEAEKAQKMEAFSMHSLMRIWKIDEIDLLKIDIEGTEKEILGTNNLWLRKVKNIIIELHKPYSIEDLDRDISPFGFQITEELSKNLFFAKNTTQSVR